MYGPWKCDPRERKYKTVKILLNALVLYSEDSLQHGSFSFVFAFVIAFTFLFSLFS